jgi:hypothetical protein
VQFYPYPELGLKKYAQDQELSIFGDFLKIVVEIAVNVISH